MSSFGGTAVALTQSDDPSLQLAPEGDKAPDFGVVKKAFEDTVNNNQPYADQCQQNYQVRYALWPGQTADGKKHGRGGTNQTEVVPWDGASDLRVYLTDEAINSKVAMICTAYRKAKLVAVPVEGNDLKRARLVTNFLQWLTKTQIPELDREVEILSNYIYEKGLGALGVFWEEKQDKTLTTITLEGLQELFPGQNILEIVNTDSFEEGILAAFEMFYGCSPARCRRILTDLRDTGEATVPVLGRKKARPVVRAFNLDEDLFIPSFTSDPESASSMFRVQYFSAEELRAFVHNDGWNADWVEDAIEHCRGKLITISQNEYNQPLSRSFVYNQQRFTDKIGVVYAYQRLSDEEGVPGIYCSIFNPLLGVDGDRSHDGFAKFGLLGYAHGQYPFTVFRREHLSRKLHDSRGIPEPGKSYQDQIKIHRDSLVDAASMAILPPIFYPIGRPPARWGAGARIPERRAGEYHYGDRPAYDPSTEKSQQLLMDSFNRYNGFVSAQTDPQFSALKNQCEVDKFMGSMSIVFRQIWALYKQYGSDKVYFRVIGVRQEDPQEFIKGDQDEDFDFTLNFSVDSMDMERQQAKLEAMAKVIATFDSQGQADRSEAFQIAMEAIDPNWAERVVSPKEVGTQRVVNETHNMLAQVFSGVDRDIDLGAPPQLTLQVMQQYAQSPDVQQRYQQDPAFRQRFDKLVKQTQFQITQHVDNAKIGRYGN